MATPNVRVTKRITVCDPAGLRPDIVIEPGTLARFVCARLVLGNDHIVAETLDEAVDFDLAGDEFEPAEGVAWCEVCEFAPATTKRDGATCCAPCAGGWDDMQTAKA